MMDESFKKYELERFIRKSINIFEEELPMLINELVDAPEAPKQTVGKKTSYRIGNTVYDCELVIMQRFIE